MTSFCHFSCDRLTVISSSFFYSSKSIKDVLQSNGSEPDKQESEKLESEKSEPDDLDSDEKDASILEVSRRRSVKSQL